MRLSIIAASAVLAAVASARDPAPVALPPGAWLGIDGNWSTLDFKLGSTSQDVNVLVSTSLSEFWVVGPGGCLPKEPHCSSARGGIYNPAASRDWTPLGIWKLGLDFLGYPGNGDYGLDTIATLDTASNNNMRMSGVLMSAINTTSYFLGLFGLGLTQGNFGNRVEESPLSQAVMDFAWIPSYSYGYTAGASYRNSPVSLTLGGYEATRFVDHSNEFTLGQSDGLARPLVRAIEATVDEGLEQPANWGSRTQALSSWNTTFNALIDSTTPYLWLPDDICDAFAEAFNLTYNSTFELYTLTNDQYNNYIKENAFSLTFSLSSFDNTDDFGGPLAVPGIVNVTIPSRAFISLLQYPFMNEAIGYGDPAVPYFTLRRTYNGSTFIIGRSFLQETYLITKYDQGLFSIHQALFPDSVTSDAQLTPVPRPDDSPYPAPAKQRSGLTAGEKAGIAVGVVAGCLVVLIGFLCYRRRQKKQHTAPEVSLEESKQGASHIDDSAPKSPISRLLSKLVRRNKSQNPKSQTGKDSQQPSEAPNSEIYELPAPIPPAELDGDDRTSLNGDTELGTESTQNMSAYDIARRKMERQLQGPVPAYSPPADGAMPPPEKTIDTSVANSLQQPSPLSSPRSPGNQSANSNTLPESLPSPMTPRTDWNIRITNLSSPTTTIPVSSTQPSGTDLSRNGPPSNSRSIASTPINPSFDPSTASLPQTRPAQRTPIDPSRVVFLGPIPESARLSRRNSLPGAMSPIAPDDARPDSGNTYDSLGSNFTVDEERRLEELTRQLNLASTQAPSPRTQSRQMPRGQTRLPPQLQLHGPELLRGLSTSTGEPDTPRSQERIDSGTELIHVPQLAQRRYSWED